MGILNGRCAKKDPIVKVLRRDFDANIFRLPSSRYQPLDLLYLEPKKKPQYFGPVDSLGVARYSEHVPVHDEVLPQFDGRVSSAIRLESALGVLSGFLAGLGGAHISFSPSFKNSKSIQFSFSEVHRKYVLPGELDTALHTVVVDIASSPQARRIQNGKFLLLDSVLYSKNFEVVLEKEKQALLEAETAALTEQIADVNAAFEVTSQPGRGLRFSGPEYLAFAFTCLELEFADGQPIQTVSYDFDVSFGLEDDEESTPEPSHYLFDLEEYDLLEIEEISD